MRIYTKTGDQGQTRLLNGETVFKDDIRLEAQGCLDELSSFLGMLIEVLPESFDSAKVFLQKIQSNLMKMMTVFSLLPKKIGKELIDELSAEEIENAIDQMEGKLPELKEFILPGGSIPAAWAHLSRVSCRKAERQIVTVFNHYEIQSEVSDTILMIINRLSDYLFVLARLCNSPKS